MRKLLLLFATLLFGIAGLMAQTVDIYINATTCGDFNVKLKPSAAINSTLTNIQFTVKWPESTDEYQSYQCFEFLCRAARHYC